MNDLIYKRSILNLIVNYYNVLNRIRYAKGLISHKIDQGLFLIMIIKNLRNLIKEKNYLESYYDREKLKRDTNKLYKISEKFSESEIFNSNEYLRSVTGYLRITGWTNSREILRFMSRNSKKFEIYSRKDLKDIKNSIAFTAHMKLTDSAELNNMVFDYLNQTESLNITPYLEQRTDPETRGYFDDITVYVNLKVRLKYIFKLRMLRKMINLDHGKIMSKKNLEEHKIIFHFFHIFINGLTTLSEYKQILKISDLRLFKLMKSDNFVKTYIHYLGENIGECYLCKQLISISGYRVVKVKNLYADDLQGKPIYAINSAKILNKSIILDSNNNLINLDRNRTYEQEFYSDHWSEVIRNNLNTNLYTLERTESHTNLYEEIIFIGGRNSSNFYHAMIEILPNIMSLTGIDDNVPIVLDERFSTEISKFVTDLTKREVIRKTNNITVKANLLFLLPLQSFIIDKPNSFNGESFFDLDIKLLSKWRELVLNEILHKENTPKPDKRIFIKRYGGNLVKRGVKNIKVFEKMIQKNGFEVIIPQNYSLHEQVKIFNSAHTVIMEEGSACGSAMFMKPGTNLILLNSNRAKNFELFKKLAEAFNIRVNRVNSKFDFTNIFYQNFWDATNKHYKVSIRNVKKLIMSLETKS
jgi:capsular polysaccharide biosynthesis protein